MLDIAVVLIGAVLGASISAIPTLKKISDHVVRSAVRASSTMIEDNEDEQKKAC